LALFPAVVEVYPSPRLALFPAVAGVFPSPFRVVLASVEVACRPLWVVAALLHRVVIVAVAAAYCHPSGQTGT
jgi:hypothetical protein